MGILVHKITEVFRKRAAEEEMIVAGLAPRWEQRNGTKDYN